MNLVLQFFTQPVFDRIIVKLKGNQEKTIAFIEHIL